MLKFRKIGKIDIYFLLISIVSLSLIVPIYISITKDFSHFFARELVRVRNSLIIDIGEHEDFIWSPDEVPDNFKVEKMPVPVLIKEDIDELFKGSKKDYDNFDASLILAGHLYSHSKNTVPIQSDTLNSYRIIINEGKGWCSDYSQVTNALNLARGIPVREWGISFDGFGGNGHAFNEIYDFNLNKWVFMDVVNGFYVLGQKENMPLSTLEFFHHLKAGNYKNLQLMSFREDLTPRESTEQLLKFYNQGTEQLFLLQGNNVISYDNNVIINRLTNISIAIGQLYGIISAVHPKLLVYPGENTDIFINSLYYKRNLFLCILFLSVLTALILFKIMISFIINTFKHKPNKDKSIITTDL